MEDCVEEAMGNRITLRQAMLRILKQAGSNENAVDSHLLTNNENVRENSTGINTSGHLSDSQNSSNKGMIRWSNVLNVLFRSNKYRFVVMKIK
jgi:hypothetical protein